MNSLPLPPASYDLGQVQDFESEQAAEEEDYARAQSLRQQAVMNPASARQLRALADRIDPDVTSTPDTLASSRYMREQRRRVIGALWQMLDARR